MSAAVLEPMRADKGTTVMYVTDGEEWRRVTVSDEVAAVEQRRVRHGIPYNGLADLAEVDRSYVGQVLKGKREPSDTFLGKLNAVLDRWEQEVGEDDAPPGSAAAAATEMVEFEVVGNFGVKVIVKGPAPELRELEETVMRLIARLQASQSDSPEGT